MSLDNFPSHMFNNEVIVDRDGGVVTITLNNPKQMNTMSAGVLPGVMQALQMCADDTTVMVVVFTGAGDRAFCAGGNLVGGGASAGMRGVASPDKPPPTVTGAVFNLRGLMGSAKLLRESHFVSIAAVNGACAGAGLSWACACDLRLGSKNALFRSSFLSAGLSGDFGGTWSLSKIVGPNKARELYLLNEKIKVEEAQRIGLVNKAIPAVGDEFRKAVHKIAKDLSNSAPLALKLIKSNLLDAERSTFAEHLDLEADRHVRSGFHPDAAEAGMSFLEKRTPSFTGLSHLEKANPWQTSKL